jgi:hypothetical protein
MLPKYFEIIENHLDKYIDNCDEIIVFDEIESPDFHLDVYCIKSDVYRNYTILMTNGVSSRPMETPEKKFSKYAEFCILLPANWNLKDNNWKNPKNYWPIKLLKSIGRYPSQNNTWLGFGHTVSAGKSIIGTKFMSVILLKSKRLPESFQKIKYGEDTIELYTIFPLYLEELNFKEKNGTDKLLELFDKENIDDIINLKRKNVCKKNKSL